FAKDTEKYTGTRLDVAALLPRGNAERYLQANYTAKAPTNREALITEDAGDGSAWSAAHARYHRFFREVVTRFDFEDALLIDTRGQVVYSVYKDVDLGTNILNGPYRGSDLREAFIEATSSNKADQVVLTDFELYQPGTMAPTAWMVAPVPESGPPIGAIALQVPITRINRLMTFDKQWEASGLGQTGETILVGEDLLMRSNSRLFLEDPQQYRQRVIDAGTPPDIADIAIRQGGTMLVQPVPPDSPVAAEKGQSGTVITTDYLGEKTLQAYSPVPGDVDPRWVIVAKIATAEAFAPEDSFTRTVVLATTGIIFGVCLLAGLLAQVFLRPIRRLQNGVQRISSGDYRVQIPVETRDEIGDLTRAFNDMSRGLTVKDELVDAHRQQIRRLLGSLMPTPIAEKFGSGQEIVARTHTNVSVIFVEVGGLGRIQADMDAVDSLEIVNELQRQFDAAAAEFGIDRVRAVRNGYLGSCGLTVPRLDNARQAVDFALECQHIIERFDTEKGMKLTLRAGIDSGTVNSGLVGEPAVMFDLWGSAVNLVSRIADGMTAPGIYVTSRVHETLSATVSFTSAGTIDDDGSSETVWRVIEED
ncbi:MAG: adenylate/guanylate cyclase domain-containing protein, partial [Candidatus Nanopelagicales bacterium]